MWQLRGKQIGKVTLLLRNGVGSEPPHPETPALPWRPPFTCQMHRGHRAPAGAQDDGCLTVSRHRKGSPQIPIERSWWISLELQASCPAHPSSWEVSPAESGPTPPSHLKVYEQKTSLRLSTAAWPLASSLHTVCRAHLGRQSQGPSPWSLCLSHLT